MAATAPLSVQVTYDLDRLSEAMRKYGKLSGKTEAEVVEKQSGKLAWNIYQGLRTIMPAKGSIRAERLASLKAGGGIYVRQSVYDEVASQYGVTVEGKFRKRGNHVIGDIYEPDTFTGTRRGLNVQALAVKKEIGLRESGRGFSAWSTPRPGQGYANVAAMESSSEVATLSRYGYTLSLFHIETAPNLEHKYAELRWVDNQAGTGGAAVMSKPKQMAILDKAIQETVADIMVYVERKQREDIAEAFGL